MLKNIIGFRNIYFLSNKNNNFYNNNKVCFSSKIYTKTGDKGTSALFNGERRSKCNPIFNVLGSVDELSSHLGVAKEQLVCLKTEIQSVDKDRTNTIHKVIEEIESIQCLLLDVGSNVATPATTSSEQHLMRAKFSDDHTTQLENWIDEHTLHLQPLKNFILPGGGLSASQLQVCRSVCRRSERELVLMREQLGEDSVNPSVMHFLNRLSDYLFTVARLSTHIQKVEESVYKRITTPNENNNNNNSNNINTDKFQRHLEKHPTKEIK
ncbi:hypothetical protein DICPUDRAFT_26607 [Dictyostelium purpureum]|uniref:Cobalamin adenosyltransferase-like domain-containing protein n=1 Tax=Dictyostelium purpureum TaxID=5786 RepID=F0Z8X0_DICPU|nr:uncharacterized protein DICPUDRAFT_26607 [Dictyostelium purpureum]EGC39618.1 hypothetical protein DICPUDRAFT_26607 [Dictyostelium purpureum]|eukprot:XP_003283839.1 hypothetical protein DICPUDRAFT_26607 [Dictyostelium purpureum]